MKFSKQGSAKSAESESRSGQDEPRFIDLKQAARRTNLSVSTLRRARDEGELPSYKPQGKVLLDVAEVDGWIRASRLPGRSEAARSGQGKPRRFTDFRSEVMMRRGT